ncbi:PAS domain-containing protein [Sulfurospirillum sp. 1307]
MSQKRLSKLDAPKNITNDEKVMGADDFIVSKTDTKGFITYANEIFIEMSGYTPQEIMGANHNLIRHPHMPRIAFKLAWDLIQNGKEFFGFVKNLKKDGGFYWVFAYITADYDSRGNIIGYSSFRRTPPRSAIEQIEPVYKLLVDAERKGGMEASGKLLNDFLEQNKTTYNALVMNLQKGA